jgi:hypothetical protein
MNPNEYVLIDRDKVSFVKILPVDLAKFLVGGKKLVSVSGKCWADSIDERSGLPKWVKEKELK